MAETLARAVAGLQENAGARQTVEQVADLLHSARSLGVEQAIEQWKRDATTSRRDERLEAERQANRRQRREGEARPLPPENKSLPSLTKTVQSIREMFPQTSVELDSHDLSANAGTPTFRHMWPRYLYRGESGAYPATTTSLARIEAGDALSIAALEDVFRATIAVRDALIEQLGIAELLADGYLQHYGFPTRFLDVTDDLDVALSFASDLGFGDTGSLCVLPTEMLHKHCILADLRNHVLAERPRRQHALALGDVPHGDLKHAATIEQLNLTWFPFQFAEEDDKVWLPNPELLDAHSDPAAGLAQLILNGCGKMHDDAARWLSQRLPPAPVAMTPVEKAAGEPAAYRLIPADAAGCGEYHEADERRNNYERWSVKFPDQSIHPPKPIPQELLMSAEQFQKLKPGATVLVLTPRGLGLQK